MSKISFFKRFVGYILNKNNQFSTLHKEEREKWGWELAHHWQVGEKIIIKQTNKETNTHKKQANKQTNKMLERYIILDNS